MAPSTAGLWLVGCFWRCFMIVFFIYVFPLLEKPWYCRKSWPFLPLVGLICVDSVRGDPTRSTMFLDPRRHRRRPTFFANGKLFQRQPQQPEFVSRSALIHWLVHVASGRFHSEMKHCEAWMFGLLVIVRCRKDGWLSFSIRIYIGYSKSNLPEDLQSWRKVNFIYQKKWSIIASQIFSWKTSQGKQTWIYWESTGEHHGFP